MYYNYKKNMQICNHKAQAERYDSDNLTGTVSTVLTTEI